MSHLNDLRKQIIEWNNMYPLDRAYRKRYNIGFGSPEHRQLCQIDIFMEFEEDKLYAEAIEKAEIEIKNEKDVKKGKWIGTEEASIDDVKSLDLFEQIDISKMTEAT